MCVYTTYFPQLVTKSCSKGSVRRCQMLTGRPEPFCQLLWLVIREKITTVTRVEEAFGGDENIQQKHFTQKDARNVLFAVLTTNMWSRMQTIFSLVSTLPATECLNKCEPQKFKQKIKYAEGNQNKVILTGRFLPCQIKRMNSMQNLIGISHSKSHYKTRTWKNPTHYICSCIF